MLFPFIMNAQTTHTVEVGPGMIYNPDELTIEEGDIVSWVSLGGTHDVNFNIPKELIITVEKQTVIKISGVDKELVSKVTADIKSLKPVEPYKAKGIKERGQFVLRKEGKKK